VKTALAALGLVALADPAWAEGLMGRDVTFGTRAWEERETPIFVGRRHPARVSDAVEYGLGPEGGQNGWDVIPAIIDIRARSIVITYPEMPAARFPVLDFNGYVLDFLTDCVLFDGVAQNMDRSTEPLSNGALFTEGGRLFIDMSGVTFGPETRVVIGVDVTPCPLG